MLPFEAAEPALTVSCEEDEPSEFTEFVEELGRLYGGRVTTSAERRRGSGVVSTLCVLSSPPELEICLENDSDSFCDGMRRLRCHPFESVERFLGGVTEGFEVAGSWTMTLARDVEIRRGVHVISIESVNSSDQGD